MNLSTPLCLSSHLVSSKTTQTTLYRKAEHTVGLQQCTGQTRGTKKRYFRFLRNQWCKPGHRQLPRAVHALGGQDAHLWHRMLLISAPWGAVLKVKSGEKYAAFCPIFSRKLTELCLGFVVYEMVPFVDWHTQLLLSRPRPLAVKQWDFAQMCHFLKA